MQLNEPLRLWEKIELTVGEGTEAGHYLARVEDLVKEGIVISTPEFVGGSTLLRDNTEVAVLVTKEDAVYLFHSRVKRIQTHLRTIYQLTAPASIRRVQRRQFVRIEQHTEIRFVSLSAASTGSVREGQLLWRQTEIVNFSGGGVLMKAHEGFRSSAPLLLHLPFLKTLGLPEMILGVCRRTFREKQAFFAGIEFITFDQLGQHLDKRVLAALPATVMDFDRSAQNKLAAYVFNQQIELRKKGLL